MVGCSHPPPATPSLPGHPRDQWAGRLALQIESDPPKSFSASFELQGSPEAGELSLYTPLGTTVAVLHWSVDKAELTASGNTQQFDSLETLSAQITGTPLPIAALFDWLAGLQTTTTGWSADLSRLEQGRLAARRSEPMPSAMLQIVFTP